LSAADAAGFGVGGGGVKLSPTESDLLHAEITLIPNSATNTSRFFMVNIFSV
jgi:hypothetical protein